MSQANDIESVDDRADELLDGTPTRLRAVVDLIDTYFTTLHETADSIRTALSNDFDGVVVVDIAPEDDEDDEDDFEDEFEDFLDDLDEEIKCGGLCVGCEIDPHTGINHYPGVDD